MLVDWLLVADLELLLLMLRNQILRSNKLLVPSTARASVCVFHRSNIVVAAAAAAVVVICSFFAGLSLSIICAIHGSVCDDASAVYIYAHAREWLKRATVRAAVIVLQAAAADGLSRQQNLETQTAHASALISWRWAIPSTAKQVCA